MLKKHILVISQYFHPEPFRINNICQEWIKRGYKVTVLTGIPNYPQGKFYKGYSWFKKRIENWRGVNIIRIPLVPRGNSRIGIITNYLSFVFFGFFWALFTNMTADCVFIFEVSPMTQALVGVWYAKWRKVKCYLYVQDLWPENVEVISGIHNRVILKYIRMMVSYIYNNCNMIFATSPSFVTQIQTRVIHKGKVKYWPQYAEEFYKPMKRCLVPEIPDDGSFKIVFTGNIGKAQGLELLPQVAMKLKKKNSITVDGKAILNKPIKFIIIGDGHNKHALEKQITNNDVEDIFVMVPRIPAERIPRLLACCDIAFISFMNDPLFAKTIPAKLQSYMACGMPIIASAIGETERIIKEADCGICCSVGNIDELTNSIEILMNSRRLKIMSENSEKYFKQHFSKKILMDQMDCYINGEISTLV